MYVYRMPYATELCCRPLILRPLNSSAMDMSAMDSSAIGVDVAVLVVCKDLSARYLIFGISDSIVRKLS